MNYVWFNEYWYLQCAILRTFRFKKSRAGGESLLKIVLRNLLGLGDWFCSRRKVANDIRKRRTFIIYFANISLYTDCQSSTHKLTIS